MLDRLKAITSTRFKRTNFKAFLTFLLFSIFIWILVQFSKEYTEVIEIPLDYVNVPKDKMILKENPKTIKLKMETTGFKLASFSLMPPTLSIDLAKARQENGFLLFNLDENQREVQAQLNIDLSNSSFINRSISIKYQQRKEKMLKVVPQIEIDFAVGYAASDILYLEPDSITVSGPDNVLDTLNQLKTIKVQLDEVKKDVEGKVAIDTLGLSNVTLYRKQIDYFLDVEKYTEGNLEIPVEILNVPEDLNVVIFPKEILLFYTVNLKDFKEVTPSDFRVVADLNELKENQEFLIPKVVKQPRMVSNVRLNENKIQFIIKK